MKARRPFLSAAVGSMFAATLWASQPEARGEAYVKALGGSPSESLVSVIAYDKTTYVSAGYTSTAGGDILLTKFDFRGDVLWTKRIGGSAEDEPFCLIKASNGDIVVTGRTNSAGTGRWDLFLARFRPNGNLRWAKTLGAVLGNEGGYCVIETYDDDLLVVGDTDRFAVAGWDVLLAKFDASNGNRRWVKRAWSAGRSDWGYRVVEMPDEDLLVAGGTATGAGELEDRDILVARFDSGGGPRWGWWIGQPLPRWEWARSLIRTSDRGYALAGWQTRHDNVCPCSSFVIKFDSTLEFEWKRIIPGESPFENYARSLIQTSDEDLVLAGGYFSPDSYSLDVWLAKANVNDGVFRWSRAFGDVGADEANDMVADGCGCGCLVAVGYTASYGDYPPNALLARCTCEGKPCIDEWDGPDSQAWHPSDGLAPLEEDTLDWEPQDWDPHVLNIVLRVTTVCEKCPGDINCDGHTDQGDLGALLSAWCLHPGDPDWNPCADLDGDGHVGQGDLGTLLADWGCTVEP
jgi:hypothetical protein